MQYERGEGDNKEQEESKTVEGRAKSMQLTACRDSMQPDNSSTRLLYTAIFRLHAISYTIVGKQNLQEEFIWPLI